MTVDELAEELRGYLEYNDKAVASVHARSVLDALYKLGYGIISMKGTHGQTH